MKTFFGDVDAIFHLDAVSHSRSAWQGNDDLFSWHGCDQNNSYLASYFPLVQSSGMGQTKLLHDWAARHPLGSQTLCCSSQPALSSSSIYTAGCVIDVSSLGTEDDLRRKIYDELDKVLRMDDVEQVAFLFDEAYHLLQGGYE